MVISSVNAFPGLTGSERGDFKSHFGHPLAAQIEPGLCRPSPENGNIFGRSRRLSANRARMSRDREAGDN